MLRLGKYWDKATSWHDITTKGFQFKMWEYLFSIEICEWWEWGGRERETTRDYKYILPCISFHVYPTMYILPCISFHVYPTMYTYHVYPTMCWSQSTALRHPFSPSSTLFGDSSLLVFHVHVYSRFANSYRYFLSHHSSTVLQMHATGSGFYWLLGFWI